MAIAKASYVPLIASNGYWSLMIVLLLSITPFNPTFGQSDIRSLPLNTALIEHVRTSDDTPGFEYRYSLKWPFELPENPVVFHSKTDSLPVLFILHQGDTIKYTEYWPTGRIKREYLEVHDYEKFPPFQLARIKDYCENGVIRGEYDWSLPIQLVRTYYCNSQLRSRFVQVHAHTNPVGVVGLIEFWYANGQKWYEEVYDENGVSIDGPRKWSEAGEVIE